MPSSIPAAKAELAAAADAACAAAASHELHGAVSECAELIFTAFASGNRVLAFGNGGSAADAMHLAAEFAGRFRRPRPPYPALALGSGAVTLTANANDFNYEDVFAREIQALGTPGDVALGFTTSGRSENVLRGLETASRRGLVSVAVTGRSGTMRQCGLALAIAVPADGVARVQELHGIVIHALAECVESRLAGAGWPGIV